MLMPETMCMVGKQAGWVPVVASTFGLNDDLLFTWDKMSGSHFFLLTRELESVFPTTGLETHTKQSGSPLVAANGSTSKTYKVCTISLCFTTKKYKWGFIIAEVSRPLLGADFMLANLLLVDFKR